MERLFHIGNHTFSQGTIDDMIYTATMWKSLVPFQQMLRRQVDNYYFMRKEEKKSLFKLLCREAGHRGGTKRAQQLRNKKKEVATYQDSQQLELPLTYSWFDDHSESATFMRNLVNED